MSETKELRFVRLRHEDVIGYVLHNEGYLTIERPLRIEIETYIDEGRQILAMQEYLPQAIISITEINIPMEEVMFSTVVKPEFVEHYESISDYFYNSKSKLKEPKKKKSEKSDDKVVSIMEAMISKKDKPVH